MQWAGIAGNQHMEAVDQRQQRLQPRFTDAVVYTLPGLRANLAQKLLRFPFVERPANQYDAHIGMLGHQLIGQPGKMRYRPTARFGRSAQLKAYRTVLAAFDARLIRRGNFHGGIVAAATQNGNQLQLAANKMAVVMEDIVGQPRFQPTNSGAVVIPDNVFSPG
ncbi:hypothetical protein D3C80_697340 [compost metagenome]